MQTIGRVVKFDVQPVHKGPKSLYDIFQKYYGKEFETLKGTTCFIHSDRHINAKESTVQFQLAGFIEFPEMNYAHPEMFIIAKEHFPHATSVGFLTERPHNCEPEHILREDDFDAFRKVWDEFKKSPEAKKHGIDPTGYGPSTPLFDFIVVQTPFSSKTSTGKKPGLMSFGQEKFIPFSLLNGEEECDCPKCDPTGIKAQLLKLLESLQKARGTTTDKMPDGELTVDFIKKAKNGSPDTCRKMMGNDGETETEMDEIDRELRKSGKIVPFDPNKGKGRVN